MPDDEKPSRINVRYVLDQLGRALASAGKRAAERVAQWRSVLGGIEEGTLQVGSREPVDGVPVWVTLEVAHGGFATGNLAAGGPLLPHERARGATDRKALNLHFVAEEGRRELEALLADGRYRVGVPEEGALLVVAWLLARGEATGAATLLDAIVPFFDRLRFYPTPHEHPARTDSSVSVATVADTVAILRAVAPQPHLTKMTEAVTTWAPLYDRAVGLFLETVEGETPALRLTEDGVLARGPVGQPVPDGGWPCRRHPDGWSERARKLLDEDARAQAEHKLCRKPLDPKENYARLRGYLATCARDPGALTGRDVGMIRKILASYVTRHGAPDSERLRATRAAQARSVSNPTHQLMARQVAARLDGYPRDEGVVDLRAHLGPVGEAALPPSLVRRALRCLEAPVAELVAAGLLPSSESLARVLPMLTAKIRAAAVADPELRRVYAGVYLAFRRRRSLLLLDLASQAKLAELPWIAAIHPWIGADEATRDAARSALTQTTILALSAYPHTIVPNKLIKELRALAAGAGIDLPLVEELAADIFMGTFSKVYLAAAQAAARRLRGSLYERYYGVPYDRVLELKSPDGLAQICRELTGSEHTSGSVAASGTVIEQSQIVTSHNLAVLVWGLDLAAALDATSGPAALAQSAFRWMCRRQKMKVTTWRAGLHRVKNLAYAWRQTLFFLSLVPPPEVTAFISFADAHLAEQPADVARRLGPVLGGLRLVAGGDRFGADGSHPAGRRFLGWSVGKHWFLDQP